MYYFTLYLQSKEKINSKTIETLTFSYNKHIEQNSQMKHNKLKNNKIHTQQNTYTTSNDKNKNTLLHQIGIKLRKRRNINHQNKNLLFIYN